MLKNAALRTAVKRHSDLQMKEEVLESKQIAYTLISGVLRVRHRNKSILHCAADYLIFQERKSDGQIWFDFRMRVCLARERAFEEFEHTHTRTHRRIRKSERGSV